MKQNHAHGTMVRINVFLTAYLQYRDSAIKQLGPGHHADVQAHRIKEEEILIRCFEEFEGKLGSIVGAYSKVTVALFIKTFTKLISNLTSYQPPRGITEAYQQRFEERLREHMQGAKKNLEGDQQIYIQEIARLLLVLSLRSNDKKVQTKQVMQVFASVFEGLTD